MTALSADEVMAHAAAATGLDDFGPNDFRDGLDRYCASVNESADLSDVGRMAIPGTVTAALVNRLEVVDYRKHHPDVADEQISAPIVVIGMFRAGTTLLSNLLEQDPRNRALLRWESSDSAPPPTPADHRVGPRVDAARAGSDLLEQINPRMRAIHHEEADGPTECISVMSQDFKSLSWEAITNVPEYGRWLLSTDHLSAYRYHREVLQVLQHGGVRGRWTLKSPHHAIALDALTTVYPDARLVLLHRDPAVLCASVCSLVNTLTSTFSDADHRSYIARHWVDDVLHQSIERINDFRDRNPAFPVLDVAYDDLVTDPVNTVNRIYDAAGNDAVPFDTDTAARIERYVTTHTKGRFGTHSYRLGEFGLDATQLRQRFATYIDRYDVAIDRSVG